MIGINGIAHIQLTATNSERSIPFYRRMLEEFGMKALIETPEFYYAIGARTGVAVCQANPEFEGETYHQRKPGLHHVCFRARSREDVDKMHKLALELDALIVHPPQEDGFAPGYYSVLFEDPDGIRLEVNHVPGKGHLTDA